MNGLVRGHKLAYSSIFMIFSSKPKWLCWHLCYSLQTLVFMVALKFILSVDFIVKTVSVCENASSSFSGRYFPAMVSIYLVNELKWRRREYKCYKLHIKFVTNKHTLLVKLPAYPNTCNGNAEAYKKRWLQRKIVKRRKNYTTMIFKIQRSYKNKTPSHKYSASILFLLLLIFRFSKTNSL